MLGIKHRYEKRPFQLSSPNKGKVEEDTTAIHLEQCLYCS